MTLKAVQNVEDATTHDDARSEGKYDTRAIESGYLAGAQRNRLIDLEQKIKYIESLQLGKEVHSEVQKFSLLKLGHRHVFIVPYVGGFTVEEDGVRVSVISPETPLAKSLMGLAVGDEWQSEEIYDLM